MRQYLVTFLSFVVGIVVATPVRAEPPVTTHLVLRDRTVTITSSADGQKYTITSHDGVVLATSLDQTQLAQAHPDLYDQLRPAIASDESLLEISPWAGM